MIQEQKDLLLKDLCARLPYGVKCVSGVDDATLIIEGINPNCNGASEVQVTYERSGINFDTKISSIKPYLFPLSSMTEEEYKEYLNIDNRSYSCPVAYAHIPASDRIDWLNAHYFDYRGLIEKGLALEAPEEMYKI